MQTPNQPSTQTSPNKPSSNGNNDTLTKKSVIVISSHVIRGSIGNRAAVFALETLEHPVWAIPTIILPWHPGHGPSTHAPIPITQFTSLLDDLKTGPKNKPNWLNEVGAILTGYMANAQQAKAVASFIKSIKTTNKNIIHICDPVMGDGDKLYINEETAIAMKEHLVSIADVITPNLFELGWLTDSRLQTVQDAHGASKKFTNQAVLTTSIPGMMRNQIGNLFVDAKNSIFTEHRIINGPPNGSGDLTAAIFLAHVLNNSNIETTLQRTTASVFEIIANSAKQGADELLLEANTHCIKRPMAMVQIRSLSKTPSLPQKIRKAPKRKPPNIDPKK